MDVFPKIEAYENKLFEFINAYEKIIKSIVNIVYVIFLSITKIVEYIVYGFSNFITSIVFPLRLITYPLHWIWIIYALRSYKPSEVDEFPFFNVGAYYIYGKPGWGKSTFVYHAMMHYAYHTGKTSYTTDSMETARTNIDGSSYYYHQLFSPGQYFIDGEQEYSFDTDLHNVIVYEEMLVKQHQRNNKQASYNNEFLPLIGSLGTQRHQGIDLFFFISQLPKNDIALMQLLSGYIIPRIKKKFDYKYWLRTGRIRFTIAGWNITYYDVEVLGDNDYQLTAKRRIYYKNQFPEDMEYFNRLNMKSKFDSLPKAERLAMYA